MCRCWWLILITETSAFVCLWLPEIIKCDSTVCVPSVVAVELVTQHLNFFNNPCTRRMKQFTCAATLQFVEAVRDGWIMDRHVSGQQERFVPLLCRTVWNCCICVDLKLGRSARNDSILLFPSISSGVTKKKNMHTLLLRSRSSEAQRCIFCFLVVFWVLLEGKEVRSVSPFVP